jgi:hypothetical protein
MFRTPSPPKYVAPTVIRTEYNINNKYEDDEKEPPSPKSPEKNPIPKIPTKQNSRNVIKSGRLETNNMFRPIDTNADADKSPRRARRKLNMEEEKMGDHKKESWWFYSCLL